MSLLKRIEQGQAEEKMPSLANENNTDEGPIESSSRMSGLSARRVAPPSSGQSDVRDLKARVQNKLLAELDPSMDVSQTVEVRQTIEELFENILADERIVLSRPERRRLFEQIVAEILGLGPIEPLLADTSITEIMVNGYDRVYIQKDGKIELAKVKFDSNQHLLHTIQKMLAASGSSRRVDESSPYVDFSVGDGSRANVILPPCSLVGPVLTIRKFANIQTIDDLLGLGMMDKKMATLLIAAMKAKLNVVFCGATGTGKTTALNVLSRHIPEEERIITIEDTPELRLKQKHVVTLQSKQANIEGKGVISIRDLFVNSLRMRPDRLIVGEVRSEEMLDLIESIASGHSGALAIVHAESPEDCFNRMITMMLLTGIRLSTEVIVEQIARAIDLIVHIELSQDGVRRLINLTDIRYDKETGKVALDDIFAFEQERLDEKGKIIGRWKMDKKEPSFYPKFAKRYVKLPDGFFE